MRELRPAADWLDRRGREGGLAVVLQCRDAFRQWRVAHEHAFNAAAVNAERGELAGQFTRFLRALQGLQGGDHVLTSGELRAAGVGAEFAITREPHHQHGSENRQGDLRYYLRDVIGRAVTAFGFKHDAVYHVAYDGGEKIYEGVDDALYQRHGDHVAVGDVAKLVAEHRFHFVGVHVMQQAGADGDQGMVAVGAGGEGVRFRGVEHADFRHADAGLLGQAGDGHHQPLLGLVLRPVYDFYAHGVFGHPFGHEQGDDGAGHADDGRHGEQGFQVEVDALRVEGVAQAEHAKNNAYRDHDREVGR